MFRDLKTLQNIGGFFCVTQKSLKKGKEEADFSAVCFLFPPNTLRFLCVIKQGPRISGLDSIFPWGRSTPLWPPGPFQSADSSNVGWPTQKWSILLTNSKHMGCLWGSSFWKKSCTVSIWKGGGYFQKLLWEGGWPLPSRGEPSSLVFGENVSSIPPSLPPSHPLSSSLFFLARACFLCSLVNHLY